MFNLIKEEIVQQKLRKLNREYELVIDFGGQTAKLPVLYNI